MCSRGCISGGVGHEKQRLTCNDRAGLIIGIFLPGGAIGIFHPDRGGIPIQVAAFQFLYWIRIWPLASNRLTSKVRLLIAEVRPARGTCHHSTTYWRLGAVPIVRWYR